MSLNVLFTFTVAAVGFLITLIILYKHRLKSSYFLALFLAMLSISNFMMFLFESRLVVQMPHFFRTGPLANYLIAPAMFMYILYVFNEKRKFQWYDLLHLLPALIFFIDYAPFYFSSVEHKRAVVSNILINVTRAMHFQEGWLVPPKVHYIMRHSIAILYVLFLCNLLAKQSRHGTAKIRENTELFGWLRILLIVFFAFSAAGAITFFFVNSSFSWVLTVWEPVIVVSVLGLVMFFKPHVLYGPFDITVQENANGDKAKHLVLHDEQLSYVQARLQQFMDKQHYTRKNIKLKEVADEIGVQSYILSAYINQIYRMRFNDFINWGRIQYVQQGIRTGQWNMLTLEAIAEEAGFSNRTTFVSAFKKFAGMTPTAFLHDNSRQDGQDGLQG